jgi:hypothetical protein
LAYSVLASTEDGGRGKGGLGAMKHTGPVGAAARGNRKNVAEERSMRG